MAANARASSEDFEEILFENDRVSLCLLLNRRHRSMRVIDFRSGPNPAKRIFVLSLAQREGIDRVYTLVEREEVSTWSRMGFTREGSIPAFYKRSDAHILGALVPDALPASDDAEETGIRPALGDPKGKAFARHYQEARKLSKERADRPLPPVRVHTRRPQDVQRARATAIRRGRALTGFEPFGRDVERQEFLCTGRGGFSLGASVETQACFSNGFLELLSSPRTEKEAALTTSAIGRLSDELTERGIVSCFATTPVDDVPLSVAFLVNGFKKTARLQQHLLRDGGRVDAVLWSRKLAGADED